MDSKGRPTAADIADRQYLKSVDAKTESELTMFFPRKVLQAKARKLAKRGLIEITADAWPRWITEKGRELLLAPSK